MWDGVVGEEGEEGEEEGGDKARERDERGDGVVVWVGGGEGETKCVKGGEGGGGETRVEVVCISV